MAGNNVNVTPGAGTVVAAEDISGVKYQEVKLIDGNAGSTIPVEADALGNLCVTLNDLLVQITSNGRIYKWQMLTLELF